jgi:hypothetical protein
MFSVPVPVGILISLATFYFLSPFQIRTVEEEVWHLQKQIIVLTLVLFMNGMLT